MRAFVYVALRTGARRGELLRLGWGCVSLDGDRPSVLFVETKGRRDRRVPIDGETVSVLRRLQAQTQREGGPFVGLAGTIKACWRETVKAAGVAPVAVQDLRRSFVTRALRAGVPLTTVQKLAGHRQITTTTTYYAQVNDDDLRAGVAKMARKRKAG